MSEVFISYARSTATQAGAVAEALRALGHRVWLDDALPAHRAYAEVIEERLKSAGAVVVIWSADAVLSQWVRSEADKGRAAGKLVQLSVDGVFPPMPFDQIQCADLAGWNGEPEAAGWRKVAASIADLTGDPGLSGASGAPGPSPPLRRLSICVLPFANMSGDPEQEYFSDGISEDIITDLSKVTALSVVARNTSFTFKGRAVDVAKVARQLNVGHVLEGSVRKAGGRVRITAQLIDGATGDHLWAERWDRDLTDIFAIQDEISEAIVGALKLRLLPEEKAGIERRGTTSADAYNLYLMARQYLVSGNEGDIRASEAILRLCRRAIELDPGYARVWALMALAETSLRFVGGRPEDGLAAVEQALLLDPDLAEAHAIMARHRFRQGRLGEAADEIEIAVRLDPDSYEVNMNAGLVRFKEGRLADAIGHYEKATALMETGITAPGMLLTYYGKIGDGEGARRAARTTLARAESMLAREQGNGTAMGFGVCALAVLGEAERARDWIGRALLTDPDNIGMRYNFACALSRDLGDIDGAVDLITAFFAKATEGDLNWVDIDPDLDRIREDPRFQAMRAAAHARLAASDGLASPAPS